MYGSASTRGGGAERWWDGEGVDCGEDAVEKDSLGVCSFLGSGGRPALGTPRFFLLVQYNNCQLEYVLVLRLNTFLEFHL